MLDASAFLCIFVTGLRPHISTTGGYQICISLLDFFSLSLSSALSSLSSFHTAAVMSLFLFDFVKERNKLHEGKLQTPPEL